MKEVAPITSRDTAKQKFWKHDIKIARDFNQSAYTEEVKELHRRISKEYSDIPNFHFRPEDNSHRIHKDAARMNIQKPQYTWSPGTAEGRPTLSELRKLYTNFRKEECRANKSLKFRSPEFDFGRRLTLSGSSFFRHHRHSVDISQGSDTCASCESRPLLDNSPQQGSIGSAIPYSARKKFVVTPSHVDNSAGCF